MKYNNIVWDSLNLIYSMGNHNLKINLTWYEIVHYVKNFKIIEPVLSDY